MRGVDCRRKVYENLNSVEVGKSPAKTFSTNSTAK